MIHIIVIDEFNLSESCLAYKGSYNHNPSNEHNTEPDWELLEVTEKKE